MKKYILVLSILLVVITGCGNKNSNSSNNAKTINDKFKSGGYKEASSNYFIKTESDESYMLFDLNEKTITYDSEKDDSQLEYNIMDNTAWMYGCRYHYDDDTTTNDGKGFGECDEDTIKFLKNSKVVLVSELKRLDITYDELKK